VVESARVAEVMSRAVPSPQRGGRRAAVHALSSFCCGQELDDKDYENTVIERIKDDDTEHYDKGNKNTVITAKRTR
jgi:hypothetical protein